MLISSDVKLDFDDILIAPQRSEGLSRADVKLERKFVGRHNPSFGFYGIPIIASNMYATGSAKMAKSLGNHRMFTALHKYHDLDNVKKIAREDLVFVTIGESDKDIDFLKRIVDPDGTEYIYLINIDVANGYRSSFSKFVSKVRSLFPRDIIMAGNVVTPEMTQELILAGADIVKIGIGPGSVCETRKVTGVGYPQISAIIECGNAAHCLKGYICSDGGCKTSGDICKAFCAGADLVMLGGMLAGTDECDGDWTYNNRKIYQYTKPDLNGKIWCAEESYLAFTQGFETIYVCTHDPKKHGQVIEEGQKKSLKFYGMSSREAMEKHGGSDKEYRASEGKCIEVPYKGPVENIVKEILGGLRSCGTYIGAMDIKHFPKCAHLVKVHKHS